MVRAPQPGAVVRVLEVRALAVAVDALAVGVRAVVQAQFCTRREGRGEHRVLNTIGGVGRSMPSRRSVGGAKHGKRYKKHRYRPMLI